MSKCKLTNLEPKYWRVWGNDTWTAVNYYSEAVLMAQHYCSKFEQVCIEPMTIDHIGLEIEWVKE